MEKENYEHEIYKHCEEKDADAIAWAFVNKEKMVKFPFKFPPIGPKEVRINILYAGLCQSDVMTVREHWGKVKYPLAPGHEIIGEVTLVGSEVKDFKKGDKVGFGTRRYCCGQCEACKRGLETCCENRAERQTYGKYWGGYATQMQQPADHYFHLPEGFDLAKGAPLFCAGATTFSPIKKYLKPGMKAAVAGVGGLGHVALQFLHKMGHHVTGLTQSLDKKDLIISLGGDGILNMKDEEAVKKAYNSFDFIINTLPTNNGYSTLIKLTAPGGVLVQVGEGPSNEPNVCCLAVEVVAKELTLCGSLVGSRKLIREMIPFCMEKKVYPMVEEYPFDEFPKAFHRIEKERPKFRCVVNVKDWAEKNGWKK